MKKIFGCFLLLSALSTPVLASDKLTVGITLHPYYSYVHHVLGDHGEVAPLIEAGFNAHNYQLNPADIERLNRFDALVVNGIGHDEFAMLAVEKLNPQGLTVIHANQSVPLIGNGSKVNPHTFVSIDAAIRQIYTIAQQLGELAPQHKQDFLRNAIAYGRALRALKAPVQEVLIGTDLSDIRIASTHGAYGYLLQEFGLTVSAVVEPAHGVSPTASQLQETIDTIKALNIDLLFTELNMENRYIDTIERETGIKVYHFSHMTHGEYSADMVELEMGHNLEKLAEALLSATDSTVKTESAQ